MSIFRRVLVPLEFDSDVESDGDTEDEAFQAGEGRVRLSASTQAAIRLAGTLATHFVELVHATPDLSRAAIYGGADGAWLPGSPLLELEAAAIATSREIMDHIGAKLLPGLEVTSHAVAGRPIDVIMDIAEQRPPDAIVLAASARGRVRRMVVGSTIDKIIRRAPCAVVVVPDAHQ